MIMLCADVCWMQALVSRMGGQERPSSLTLAVLPGVTRACLQCGERGRIKVTERCYHIHPQSRKPQDCSSVSCQGCRAAMDNAALPRATPALLHFGEGDRWGVRCRSSPGAERLASSGSHDCTHTFADICPQPQVGLNIVRSTRCTVEIRQKKARLGTAALCICSVSSFALLLQQCVMSVWFLLSHTFVVGRYQTYMSRPSLNPLRSSEQGKVLTRHCLHPAKIPPPYSPPPYQHPTP
ncbi:hypothetical protein SRHO_G00042170 [Serrasalmus rhombeus]